VRLPAGSSSAQQLSRPLLRCGPVPSAEELSRTPATSAATPALLPTPLRHPRSVAGAVLPSRLASGRSLGGTRPTRAWSATPSCSGGTFCRGSGPRRSPRLQRRPAARRRPRRTSGEGSGRRTCLRGERSVGSSASKYLIQPSHLPIFTVWMATDESGRIVSYFEDPPLSWHHLLEVLPDGSPSSTSTA
jgi:hypothetical protein